MIELRTYNSVAKFLHWTIGLGILFMIALGWYMGTIPRGDPMKFTYFQLHKSVGITILLLALFRLAWRFTHAAPALPDHMAGWEKLLARLVVYVFYVLMIAVPFIGWATVSSSPRNIPTLLYGIVPWPHLPILPDLENKKEVSELFGQIHGYLAYSILGFLVLHIGGALKHHFIEKDDVLTGMTPSFLNNFLNRLRRQK